MVGVVGDDIGHVVDVGAGHEAAGYLLHLLVRRVGDHGRGSYNETGISVTPMPASDELHVVELDDGEGVVVLGHHLARPAGGGGAGAVDVDKDAICLVVAVGLGVGGAGGAFKGSGDGVARLSSAAQCASLCVPLLYTWLLNFL